jgi:hypothetical protein
MKEREFISQKPFDGFPHDPRDGNLVLLGDLSKLGVILGGQAY